jgi:hypothetical protein
MYLVDLSFVICKLKYNYIYIYIFPINETELPKGQKLSH